ncbi:agmatinase [Aneurinibacillus aneurinilyticus]|jgi:agmatinase|uniref:Agmatinase n=2 Tax=Aneurinibacillus aneurinilyticus TaxID=1391 RepID=A0A848CW54_ANEAE|nr:agmatinase [Aneurinibacillus aneurinilyticus]ERI07125.1 agmatinase [Aneurinibacillus aneurinilyticus ATCC 12856]MCI1693471.1 agmatinase [Aneurinibacillus aneurinilyticus]MED0672526.1 agmatinase [Aneurinibacillus aneurinilyticus]MED0704531.1 agmatinase [Aneurinibacillus aneurinilyticus]MED0725161.1 agmatinase [Aneurinibacillus aneurinilyticus]
MKYPLSPDVKPEFCTTGTFMRLPSQRENAKIAILGMPFDTAASFRVGARFAPQAIRQASMTLFPYHPIHNVYPFDDTNAIDIGDVSVIPHNIHRSYELIEQSVVGLMQQGIVPIGLGGDHSVTLASLRAAAKVYGPVAMIHFDSHTDTWDTYYDEKYWHGSPFIRAHEEGLLQPDKVFQIGIRGTLNHPGDLQASYDLGYRVITTPDLRKRGFENLLQELRETIGDTPCFLTFDIDFVDPSCAPGTGTLEVGGFSSLETLEMVRSLTGFNYIGFDLVEVLPPYDPTQITSLLAATLVHDFASLIALNTKQDK